MTIEGVNLLQILNRQWFGVKPTLNVNVFVRQNYRGMSVQVSRCFYFVNFEILEFLVFINLEIKIGLCLDLFVQLLFKILNLLIFKFLLELQIVNLLSY